MVRGVIQGHPRRASLLTEQGFIQVALIFCRLHHVSPLLSIMMEGASLRLKISIFSN